MKQKLHKIFVLLPLLFVAMVAYAQSPSYEGENKKGTPEGQGVMKWGNDATFEGTFLKGNPVQGKLSLYKNGNLVEEMTGTFKVAKHKGDLMPSDISFNEAKGFIKWGNDAVFEGTYTWQKKEDIMKGTFFKYKDGKLIEETQGTFIVTDHEGELMPSHVIADGNYMKRRCYGPNAPYIYMEGSFNRGRIAADYFVSSNCVEYGVAENQNGKFEHNSMGLYRKWEPGNKKVYKQFMGESSTEDLAGYVNLMSAIYFPELIIRKYQDYARPNVMKKNLGSGLVPSPDQETFVLEQNIQWSGEIKDGKINGKGYGVYHDLFSAIITTAREKHEYFDPKNITKDFRYIYLEGTFVDGKPVGKVKYQVYDEREFNNITKKGYDNIEFGNAFSNGMRSLVIDGKYGFVDKDYKLVIAPQFSGLVSAFNASGQAVVKNDKGEEIVIDQTGKNLGYSGHQKSLFAEADRKQKQEVRDNDLNYVAGIVNAKDRNYYPNSTSFTRRPLDDIENAIQVCGKYSNDKAFQNHRSTLEKLKTTETANYKKASAEHDKYMVAYRESQARERESQARETASRKGNVSDVRIERVEQPNLWNEPFNQMQNGKVTIKYKGYTIFAGFGIQYSNNRPYSWNFSVSDYYGIAYSYDEMIKKIKETVVANY